MHTEMYLEAEDLLKINWVEIEEYLQAKIPTDVFNFEYFSKIEAFIFQNYKAKVKIYLDDLKVLAIIILYTDEKFKIQVAVNSEGAQILKLNPEYIVRIYLYYIFLQKMENLQQC